MLKRLLVAIGLVLFAGSTAVLAGASDKPVSWQIDFGYTIVQGQAGDVIDDGTTIGFGAVWRPSPKSGIGWRFDGTFDWFDVNTGNIPTGEVRIDDGDASQWSLRAGIQWESSGDRAHVTLGAGIGGYRLHAELEQTVLVPGYICDPYWYWICYPGLVAGDVVVSDKTLTKFGYYASAGVVFPLANSDFFLEAQYHFVNVEEYFETLPIVLGWRW